MGLLILGIVCSVALVFTLIFALYRHQDKFVIQKVLYPTTSMSLYDDIDLYTTITALYKNKYYLDTQRFDQNTLVSTIHSQYPFVSDILIKSFANNRLVLQPVFEEPLLLAYHRGKQYALYQNNIVPLDSGNMLGKDSLVVYLPQYLSGSLFLSGILYAQEDIEKFASDIQAIYQLPFSGVVTYMPGGEKYAYGNLNRYIYFNAKKPLSGQIQQFYELLHNYPKFSSLQRIDIGSTDYPIVR